MHHQNKSRPLTSLHGVDTINRSKQSQNTTLTMELLKVLVLLSLSLVVASSIVGDKEANSASTKWMTDSEHNEKMDTIKEDRATYAIEPMKLNSVRADLSTTTRCSTSFCGWNHGSCCSRYYCVGLGAGPGRCLRCSTSFCGGGSNGACCSGYYCVGLGASAGRCLRCSGSGNFCGGGSHGPCCSGLSCVGLGVGPGICK